MNMHASEDLRIIRCFDGIKFSFGLLDLNYSHLHESCLNIYGQSESVLPALNHAWSFVDYGHRIREISESIPGLSSDNPERKHFLENTKLIGNYRNYVQHLKKELGKKDIDPFLVMGSLSWIGADEKNGHLVVFGSKLKARYGGLVYDQKERRWVSKVTLALGNSSLNFDPMFHEIKQWVEYILPWLKEKYADGFESFEDLPIFTFQIVKEGT
jgi:hypothetical protein